MKIIDPHVHLFDLQKGDYHWLKPEQPPQWSDKALIHQSYNQQHLTLKTPLTLAGFVHIEAGFSNQFPWQEIDWLEKTVSIPFKSITFIDITKSSESFDQDIQQLMRYSSVVGCRYILDEQAVPLLKSRQVIRNLERLAELNWLFELHVTFGDPELIHVLSMLASESRTPNMVINHAGFPPHISQLNQWQQWRHQMAQLAQFEHLSIKLSGWEMTKRNYDAAWIESCLHPILQSFGEHRTMVASNFPLTLFSKPYQQLWQTYITELSLSESSLKQLCFDNANRIYQVNI